MTLQFAAAGRTHPGLVRDHNEDAFHIGRQLVVVADGVGGAAAGEVASGILIDAFAHVDQPTSEEDIYRLLTEAVEKANCSIAEHVAAHPERDGMGTTVTAMMWCEGRIVIAQVGDSRAYYRAAGEKELTQVTRDDSLVQFLVDSGQLLPEEASGHPMRNVIIKSVGGEAVEPSFASFAPQVGDRFLLCSDGLSDYVNMMAITPALEENSRATAADRLIELALAAGAPDNVTAVVVDIFDDDPPTTVMAPVTADVPTVAIERVPSELADAGQ